MNEEIRRYIETLFKDVPQSPRAGELKEEMLINLNEKYEDLLESHDAKKAYELVIEGMGDPNELIGFLRDSESAQEHLEADFDELSGIETIEIDAYSLNIHVSATGDERFSAAVRSTIGKSGVKTRITTERVGDRLIVRQEKRPWFFLFYPLFEQLDVRLPHGYARGLEIRCKSGNADVYSGAPAELDSLKLDVFSGNVRLGGVSCDAYSIECVSGNITIASLSGSGEVVCHSGKIAIDRLSGATHRLKLTSGNLAAERLSGNVTAELTSGGIKIESFRGEGSFSATSGNIRVDIDELCGDCSLRSTSGNIKAHISPSVSFKFEGNCRSGSIKTNLKELYDAKGKRAFAESGTNPQNIVKASVVSGNIGVYVK